MRDLVREGGCGCGHVRYRVTGDPIFVNLCHCRQCQQQTGASAAHNAFFETERVELLSGSLTEHTTPTGSGGTQTICRCTRCGVAVWSFYPSLGRLLLALRAGTLDDPAAFPPDAVIFLSDALPWGPRPEGIPHFERTYRAKDFLPPDRLARLMGVAAKKKDLDTRG